MDEEMSVWGFIHGTGAGCASIAAWEGLHSVFTGPVLFISFTVVTCGMFHVVHVHRKHLQKRKSGS